MSDAVASAKVCSICGEDCGGRPRVKDEKGRYSCRTCHDRQVAEQQKAVTRAKAAAPVAALPADDDTLPASFWDNGSAQSAVGAERCPSCTAMLIGGAVVCLSCGHNRQTGRSSKVKVARAARERSGAGLKLNVSPNRVAAGLLVLFGAGFFLAVRSETAAWAYYAMALLLSLSAMISTTVSAFMDKRTGWGIACVLSFVVPGVALGMLYYALCLTERGMIKVLMAVSLIVGIASIFALFLAGVDLSQLRPAR